MITIKMFDYDNSNTLEFAKDPEDMRSSYEFVHDTLLDLDVPDWVFDYALTNVKACTNARLVVVKCRGVSYSVSVLE